MGTNSFKSSVAVSCDVTHLLADDSLCDLLREDSLRDLHREDSFRDLHRKDSLGEDSLGKDPLGNSLGDSLGEESLERTRGPGILVARTVISG